MIHKKFLIGIIFAIFASLSFGNLIYCPPSVTCINKDYHDCRPNKIDPRWFPISGYGVKPLHTYFLTSVWAYSTGKTPICQYSNLNNSTLIVYISNNLYYPHLLPGFWTLDPTQAELWACPMPKQYPVSPEDCPFTTTKSSDDHRL